jgi:hypothetical protein
MKRFHNTVIVTALIITTTLSFVFITFQSAMAATYTLTNPGTTVTLPNEKPGSGHAIGEHVLRGEPCQAFQNENNPVSAQSGASGHGIHC